MADTTLVGSGLLGNSDQMHRSDGLVSTAPAVGYFIYGLGGSGSDLLWRKWASGSWGSANTISSATSTSHATWYDRWTPGDSGAKIHVVFLETEADDVLYNALDTADDTLDGEVSVDTPAVAFSSASISASQISMTKSVGGNLYCFACPDNGVTPQFYRSTDGGANWTTRDNTGLLESSADRVMLMPGNETDTNDIYALYWDNSAGAITIKTYDNSADSWSESSTILSVTATITSQDRWEWDAVPRHSDGHTILVLTNNWDNADADLVVVNITNNTTWASLTNVITNTDDHRSPRIFINQQNDDLYVGYNGQDDGGQILNVATQAHYQLSTDDGSTWGGELTYQEGAADDYRMLIGSKSVDNAGGEFMMVFFNDDTQDYYINHVNDVNIAAVVVTRTPSLTLLGVG